MTKLLTTLLIVAGFSSAGVLAQGTVTTMDYDVRTLIRDRAQARSQQDVQVPVQAQPSRDWETGGYVPRLDIQ